MNYQKYLSYLLTTYTILSISQTLGIYLILEPLAISLAVTVWCISLYVENSFQFISTKTLRKMSKISKQYIYNIYIYIYIYKCIFIYYLKLYKRLLLIVCTIMLQNCFEEKNVELYIRERLFVTKMHQKKPNAETLCKIWFVPLVPWLPSSMSNHDGKWVFYDYHICFFICTRFVSER